MRSRATRRTDCPIRTHAVIHVGSHPRHPTRRYTPPLGVMQVRMTVQRPMWSQASRPMVHTAAMAIARQMTLRMRFTRRHVVRRQVHSSAMSQTRHEAGKQALTQAVCSA